MSRDATRGGLRLRLRNKGTRGDSEQPEGVGESPLIRAKDQCRGLGAHLFDRGRFVGFKLHQGVTSVCREKRELADDEIYK